MGTRAVGGASFGCVAIGVAELIVAVPQAASSDSASPIVSHIDPGTARQGKCRRKTDRELCFTASLLIFTSYLPTKSIAAAERYVYAGKPLLSFA